jgi:hypothetical protein
LLYAHHGPTGRERLRRGAAERLAARGRVLPIGALFAHPRAAELRYLIELKCGRGAPRAALQALRRLAEEAGVGERVWLAASSLELLTTAHEVAPAWPRVLFAAPGGQDRVWHKPTTRTLRSLWAHGLRPRLPEGLIQMLCPIGLTPRSPAQHAVLAAAARARGLGYLPGRVTSRATLEALAGAGHPGAFVYAQPGELHYLARSSARGKRSALEGR